MMASQKGQSEESHKLQESQVKQQLTSKIENLMNGRKNLMNQIENIKKRDKKDKHYDINHDNVGFGKWLAYQISVQMMSNKIFNLNAIDKQGKELFENPSESYKKNFKFFKEERLWWLAMVLHDPYGKEIINFNAIVKQTLVKKMKEMMPENFDKTQNLVT